MVDKEHEKSVAERRLLRARDHVNNFWFPVNEELHKKIKLTVENNGYCEVAPLISEIKGDFSLFMYCLREVAALLKEEGHEVPLTSHPIDLLQWAGLERLKNILSRETAKISPHSLQAPHSYQKAQFEESLISAVSSQVLSEKLGIDPDIAFSTALLRQLGYALIAWNYASVYHQALLSVRPTEPLDIVLTRLLGFSPSSLAMAVVAEWGLASYIQSAVKSGDDNDIASGAFSTESIAITKSLLKVCKVSEALARANNPTLHAGAQRDWKFAKQEIAKTLGEQGMSMITERLMESASSYVTLLPQVFKGAFILDPVANLRKTDVRITYEPNPYVYKCSQGLKQNLLNLYSRMGVEEVSTLIRELVREVIPSSCFTKGCVYTVDPGLGWLIPQLGIGKTNIQLLKSRSVKQDEQETDVIVRAYNSTENIVGSVNDSDNPHSYLARVLGASQRHGVIYLETEQMLNEMLRNSTRDDFNAVAMALTDCLSLI